MTHSNTPSTPSSIPPSGESLFSLKTPYPPSGDQPKAIEQLTQRLKNGSPHSILLGVTGSGKTFTMANVIAKLNRPTLVLAHNKTLAAQLCSEFKTFFPDNAVEYFISYYDYYQPEAYIPARDVYIEKEAQINEEIERLRHSATRSLLTRRDVIIVASVSCIYGLGLPEDYLRGVIRLDVGQRYARHAFLDSLHMAQYERNDTELARGRFRVHGDTIDIFPSWSEEVLRIEWFGDEIDRMSFLHPITHDVLESFTHFDLFPATHYVVNDNITEAMQNIKKEMVEQVAYFKSKGQLVEAQRIEQRTKYDLEMISEMGYCKGIENYSRQLSFRQAGEPPGVLLDFFPNDFVTVIDESHVTIPQLRGMYAGDRSRKLSLIDFGFRLPSAADNRPLQFEEFCQKVGQCVYVSATPGPYELQHCENPDAQRDDIWNGFDIVEQIIRPTGLVDPIIYVQSTTGQIAHLEHEIQKRVEKKERVLVSTLTKKMSEDLTAYLEENGFKVRYLHSEIHALDRLDILHDLRLGTFDILIGVNLLREGLDLPEVSLVAIMDADKEGFLRNERSLIQTMGRAARNVNGTVILYADAITPSMERAISETTRRREIQLAYNKAHHITPQTIRKDISDIRSDARATLKKLKLEIPKLKADPKAQQQLIKVLTAQMEEAAKNLQFEIAAVIRDQIQELEETN